MNEGCTHKEASRSAWTERVLERLQAGRTSFSRVELAIVRHDQPKCFHMTSRKIIVRKPNLEPIIFFQVTNIVALIVGLACCKDIVAKSNYEVAKRYFKLTPAMFIISLLNRAISLIFTIILLIGLQKVKQLSVFNLFL